MVSVLKKTEEHLCGESEESNSRARQYVGTKGDKEVRLKERHSGPAAKNSHFERRAARAQSEAAFAVSLRC